MVEAPFSRSAMFERAEDVALRALGYLRSNRAELDRFASSTGFSSFDLMRQPARPKHLAAVLDFFIANEPALLKFARAVDLPPEAAYEARRMYGREMTSKGESAARL
jgi:hypothetical protein